MFRADYTPNAQGGGMFVIAGIRGEKSFRNGIARSWFRSAEDAGDIAKLIEVNVPNASFKLVSELLSRIAAGRGFTVNIDDGEIVYEIARIARGKPSRG